MIITQHFLSFCFFGTSYGDGLSGNTTPNENEQIEEDPSTVDLLNALKALGRTDDGLGIGFFNKKRLSSYINKN